MGRKKSNQTKQNMLGKYFIFVDVCWLFSKSNFSKNYFRNTIRVTNSLDPDQTQRFVRPGLGPNCLQIQYSSADDKSRRWQPKN